MIRDTVSKIETRLQGAGNLNDESRQELLSLIATLKAEVTELSKTDAEQAQSIAGFASASAHEAIRELRKPELLEHSLGGLRASVEGFEQSHPRLVAIVDRFCTTLSNIGI